MSWKISTDRPILVEGTQERTEAVYEIVWDGSVPRHLEKIEVDLFINNISTTFGTDLGFGNANTPIHTVTLTQDEKTGVFRGTFKISTEGDEISEGFEVFEVQARTARWHETDVATPTVSRVDANAFGGIIDDDFDGVFVPFWVPNFAMVVDQLLEDGKVDADAHGVIRSMVDQYLGIGDGEEGESKNSGTGNVLKFEPNAQSKPDKSSFEGLKPKPEITAPDATSDTFIYRRETIETVNGTVDLLPFTDKSLSALRDAGMPEECIDALYPIPCTEFPGIGVNMEFVHWADAFPWG